MLSVSAVNLMDRKHEGSLLLYDEQMDRNIVILSLFGKVDTDISITHSQVFYKIALAAGLVAMSLDQEDNKKKLQAEVFTQRKMDFSGNRSVQQCV